MICMYVCYMLFNKYSNTQKIIADAVSGIVRQGTVSVVTLTIYITFSKAPTNSQRPEFNLRLYTIYLAHAPRDRV